MLRPHGDRFGVFALWLVHARLGVLSAVQQCGGVEDRPVYRSAMFAFAQRQRSSLLPLAGVVY
jgi:hypothetical protein